jgi:acyl-CoA thioester hydrolase
LDWDLPSPHLTSLAVERADIDAYEHVNNAVYMVWFDRAAWDHSAALGLPIEKCLQLDRGMAVVRSVIAYLRPAVLGDTVQAATWLLPSDGKLRVRRRFQVRRDADGVTLARAEIEYACIELSSGRPTRWPPEFRERYVALDEVLRAVGRLAAV